MQTIDRRNRGPRLADIPEIARPVGMHGRLAQAEVGGAVCFGIAVSLAKRMA